MIRVICNSKFKLDPFLDGGSKRSVQIREILSENGIQYEDDVFMLPKGIPTHQLLKWSFRAVLFINKYYPKKRIKSLFQYIRLIKYYALRIPVVYDKYFHQRVVFLWENTNDCDIVYLMKATGHKVIGMPHNIESITHSQSIKALGSEIEILKQCDAVFTISKEETWLLRLMGIDAHYLPYYPPKKAECFLLSVQKKRSERLGLGHNMFALLGSATNVPTRDGMQSLINHFSCHVLPFDFIIAGYGTEVLHIPDNSRLLFKGTLSNDELEELLVSIDAIIIYQPPTTGALTRISEMMVAGIPVFANFDACRDYHNLPGINCYETLDELFTSLKSFKRLHNTDMTAVCNPDPSSFVGLITSIS